MGRLDDVKEPLMSDREALSLVCEYKPYITAALNDNVKEAVEVAIRALEDKILREDDLK